MKWRFPLLKKRKEDHDGKLYLNTRWKPTCIEDSLAAGAGLGWGAEQGCSRCGHSTQVAHSPGRRQVSTQVTATWGGGGLWNWGRELGQIRTPWEAWRLGPFWEWVTSQPPTESLAQCLEPSPATWWIWSGAGALLLGSGSRRALFPGWSVNQSRVSQLCSPSGLGPQRVSAEHARHWQTERRSWALGSPVLNCSPLDLHTHRLPPGAPGASGKTSAQQGPNRAAEAQAACPPPPEMSMDPTWYQAQGRQQGHWDEVASLMGNHATMTFGWVLNAPPSPASPCSALPPWVTINVKALSMDDYNHTKSGQMGSTPQFTAIKFTNSLWPGDKLPLLIPCSFTQSFFLQDDYFPFQSSGQRIFLLNQLDFLEHAEYFGIWRAG